MTRTGEREIQVIENAQGGKGIVTIERLFPEAFGGTVCRMFSEVTVKVGAVLGFHKHHNESETYYITQGVGMYQDNEQTYQVQTGDVVICESDNGHGMTNVGDVDLKFIALIIK